MEITIQGESQPFFQVQSEQMAGQPWQVMWERAEETLEMSPRSVSRSLTALEMTDQTTHARQTISVLPGGAGFVTRMEGRSQDAIGLLIRTPLSETDRRALDEPPRQTAERTWVFSRKDGSFVAIAASGEQVNVQPVTGSEKEALCRITMAPAKSRQIALVFDNDEVQARALAEEYAELAPPKINAKILDDLQKRAAFSMRTADELANQAYALLLAGVMDSDPRPDLSNRLAMEEYSQRCAAEFLASRSRPAILFPTDRGEATAQQRQDFLRWGSAAYRAALTYGMADEKTLRQLSLDALEGISRLQSDYTTADLEVLSDLALTDSLMRLTAAHVRMAGVMSLGEFIAQNRGDHKAQGIFRTESVAAARRAQKLFAASAAEYDHPIANVPVNLEEVFGDELPDVMPDLITFESFSVPDTALFLKMGANYGFGFLANEPAKLWSASAAIDGFIWQRWTDFIFRSDLKITETADFDSLTALLLSGSLLQTPSETSPIVSSSLPAIAAAFQNLAELYIGIKPNVQVQRVDIEPHVPSQWGRTAARVPYGTGTIEVTYQFDREFAIIGASGIASDVDIFFGYPLATGGYLRTQFTLSPDSHPQRIKLRREADGRLKLDVTEVP